MWLLADMPRDARKVTEHLADGAHSEKEKYWA